MVLPLCPRIEAVVIINSGHGVVSLGPITNLHLHLGSGVMHCSTLVINNCCSIQHGEGKDREVGHKQLKTTAAGPQRHEETKTINCIPFEQVLGHLHGRNPSFHLGGGFFVLNRV